MVSDLVLVPCDTKRPIHPGERPKKRELKNVTDIADIHTGPAIWRSTACVIGRSAAGWHVTSAAAW